jgi:hypothetical protein
MLTMKRTLDQAGGGTGGQGVCQSRRVASSIVQRETDGGGLFDPGDVPDPTMETFTKDMESWERTTPGIKHYEKNLEGL